MSVAFMKWVDKVIGSPLCLLFLFLSPLMRRKKTVPPSEILIVKFWGMGSMILAAQAFKDLRESFPHARLTAFTFQSNRDVMEWLSCADQIFSARNASLAVFLKDLLTMGKVLCTRPWDLAIDFEFGTRFTALLVAASRASGKVGFSFPGRMRDRLFTGRVPFRQELHVRQNFLELAREAGAEPSSEWAPTLFAQEAFQRAETLLTPLRREGLERGQTAQAQPTLIAVNPNAGELALERRWPLESFVSLCGELLQTGHRIVLIGGPQDEPCVQALMRQIPSTPHLISVAGKTDFQALGALLSRCDLLVSSDGGPVHLAWALSVPSVSIFGPETPVLYGPPTGPRRILYRDLPCSPCIDAAKAKTLPPCPHGLACVRGIPVSDVLEAVRSLLEERGNRS